MGQIYRATDTTPGRQVAIKILPDAFGADPERLARFEREAKALASLNHHQHRAGGRGRGDHAAAELASRGEEMTRAFQTSDFRFQT
jgi:serine/threonine protein kinase